MLADELFEPWADEVADLAEGGGLSASGKGGGVGETVVDALSGAGEDGAGFAGVVADGDDVVEMLAGEFVDRFRAVLRDIDADLAQDFHGKTIQSNRVRAGAKDFEAIPSQVAQDAFCHLAAGGIAGAEDQDTFHRQPRMRFAQDDTG